MGGCIWPINRATGASQYLYPRFMQAGEASAGGRLGASMTPNGHRGIRGNKLDKLPYRPANKDDKIPQDPNKAVMDRMRHNHRTIHLSEKTAPYR